MAHDNNILVTEIPLDQFCEHDYAKQLAGYVSESETAIKDIFDKTWEMRGPVWCGFEHPHISTILYYLVLAACCLQGRREAELFRLCWTRPPLQSNLCAGADGEEWANQARMINSHVEQALIEESVHHQRDPRNQGIMAFYEGKFRELYEEAAEEYDSFQRRQERMVKDMRSHREDVHSSQESWEEALRNGDPAAFCD